MGVLLHQLRQHPNHPQALVTVEQGPLTHGFTHRTQIGEGERRAQQLALQDRLGVAEDMARREDQVQGGDPRKRRTLTDPWERLMVREEQMNPVEVDHPIKILLRLKRNSEK